MPAPMRAKRDACSYTSALKPARRKVAATASPPMPAPTTAIESLFFISAPAFYAVMRGLMPAHRTLFRKWKAPLYFFGMPALIMTAFHFVMSDLSRLISSSDVVQWAVTPSLANLSLTSGEESTSFIALLMVSITCFGVPLGANTPFHEVTR